MPADPKTDPKINVEALHLVTYPAAVLRAKAKPVPAVTPEVREVAARMIRLMFESDGVGLAAPQVGLSWRMFVAHVPASDDRSTRDDPPTATLDPEVYINPVLSQPCGVPEVGTEGCLSLPEITGEVIRSPIITITATGLDGKTFTKTAAGFLARCWQHEMDHLEGTLILDRMTQMSRMKNRRAVKELEAAAGEDAGKKRR